MKNILKFAFFFTLGFGLMSCESFVEGFDENPNSPTDAPAATLIGGMEAAVVFSHEGDMARTSGIWSGYFTGSDRQYISYQNYEVTAGDFDNGWNNIYANGLYVTRQLQEKAAAINDLGLVSAGQICEAFLIGTAASLFGDIPYSQAGDPLGFPEPAYDAQADVYAALQTLLDDAIANAKEDGSYAYVTTLGNWKEVAYTLKARYYMHTGNYASAIAAAQNGISDPANDWLATHNATPTSYNVYYSFMDFERGGYMTADASYAYGLLDTVPGNAMYRGNAKTDESARLNFYFLFNSGDTYGTVDPNWQSGMFTPASDFPLLTYVENELILAEAYARTGDDASALAHLNNARAAHAAAYGTTYAAYDAADFDAGGIANVAGQSGSASLLREILEEKYISLYGQIEGFSDLRRTDNALGVPANTGSAIPERFYYPQGEINSNDNAPNPIPGLFVPTPVNQ